MIFSESACDSGYVVPSIANMRPLVAKRDSIVALEHMTTIKKPKLNKQSQLIQSYSATFHPSTDDLAGLEIWKHPRKTESEENPSQLIPFEQ